MLSSSITAKSGRRPSLHQIYLSTLASHFFSRAPFDYTAIAKASAQYNGFMYQTINEYINDQGKFDRRASSQSPTRWCVYGEDVAVAVAVAVQIIIHSDLGAYFMLSD